ncbi:MAG: HAD family hydrolase, partial [Anaerotignaceae bacterium]
MKYKLICMDIDGTILNDEKKLLPEVKQAILDVAKKGVHVVLASGRFPVGVDSIEKELGIPCIKICTAGTYTVLDNECIG